MPRKKKSDLPILKVRKGATLKEIYAAAHKAFTAEDLQRYCVDEPMVPAEQVLAEMEARHIELVKKYGPNGKKKRPRK